MALKPSIQQQIKEIVKNTDDSATAILYGSRAKGKAKDDSDWDILILLNKPKVSLKDEQQFRHRLYDLELKIGQPISTFVYSLLDWNTKMSNTPLFKNIQREGRVL
ncbi:MAG TPA: nucleotidyltransferase domain-containing protein [Puia sp.]|jgi:predicted nucleotidyltransferase|nr:nucleotidyltransferase domain-containing protein [Puia sp.]